MSERFGDAINLIDTPVGPKSGDVLWHMSRYRDLDFSEAQRLSAIGAVRRISADREGIAPEVQLEIDIFLQHEVDPVDIIEFLIVNTPPESFD